MEDNSLGRLVGVLLKPLETFRSIAERPTIGVAMVAVIVAGIVMTALILPRTDQAEMIREQIEKSGKTVSEAQLEQQLEMTEKFGSTIAWVSTLGAPLLLYPFLAVIFWLALKVLGGQASFQNSLSVTLHGTLPLWGVASLLTIPVVLGQAELSSEQLQHGSFLLSNLGFLASEDTPTALATLLRSLDIFTFWALALLTIGFQQAAKVSKGKAAAVVIGLWLVYVVGKIGLAVTLGSITS